MKVGVLNYGFGNIGSIINAGEKIGIEFTPINSTSEILSSEILILPGVGSFDNAVQTLKTKGFWNSIQDRINAKKPIIGICLGAQLMCLKSEEGRLSGFGIFPAAEVVRFPKGSKCPNMGWRNILNKNDKDLGFFYFTHSYYFKTTAKSDIFATSQNSIEFPAVLKKDLFWAIQFHPEKSQSNGINFLKHVISNITEARSNPSL